MLQRRQLHRPHGQRRVCRRIQCTQTRHVAQDRRADEPNRLTQARVVRARERLAQQLGNASEMRVDVEDLNPQLTLELNMRMHRTLVWRHAVEESKELEPHAQIHLRMLDDVELHVSCAQQIADVVENVVTFLLPKKRRVRTRLATCRERRWQDERRDARLVVVRK